MPIKSASAQSSSHPWHTSLKAPKNAPPRDAATYPATPLGELAYRFRELYNPAEGFAPPTSKDLAYTAHLIGHLARDMSKTPLHKRSFEDLVRINYIVTPRSIYPTAAFHFTAALSVVSGAFLRAAPRLQPIFNRAWRGGTCENLVHPLQQIALNLAWNGSDTKSIAALVSSAVPSRQRYGVADQCISGSFALLSLAREYDCKKVASILYGEALQMLYDAELRSRAYSLEPLSRPVEYRLGSLFLSDLNRAMISVDSSKYGHAWTPTELEAIDITRSWLEGGSHPIVNFINHGALLIDKGALSSFEKLYQLNGVRNFLRLRLKGADNPWSLAQTIALQSSSPKGGEDIILCAVGSGDHNNAFISRAWEFEAIREQGESEGWRLDFVEVRSADELAFHILRHGERGSRIRVLHYFGHGSPISGEFGQLEKIHRSQLVLRELFSQPKQQELLATIEANVDTVTLHTCGSAQTPIARTRKITNLAEGMYIGTKRQVTIIGLTSQDAFSTLEHKRDRTNRIVFTGKPAWYRAKVLSARPGQTVSTNSGLVSR